MNEKRVRELIRLELMEALKPGGLLYVLTQPAQVVVSAGGGMPSSDEAAARKDGDFGDLEVDKMARKVAQDGLAPLALKIGKRMEAGMSNDLAIVLAQKDEGFDLTPEAFDVDPKAGSWFNKYTDPTGGARAEKFTETFINKVKDGASREDAYEQTCNEMGLNCKRKEGAYDKIFAELPAVAGGAFQKSLKEAQSELSYDSPRLLAGGSLGGADQDVD